MESLTLEQYRYMVEQVIEYKRLNGEMPEYIKIDGHCIDRENYLEMIERVNKFLLELGRNPSVVEICTPKKSKSLEVLVY